RDHDANAAAVALRWDARTEELVGATLETAAPVHEGARLGLADFETRRLSARETIQAHQDGIDRCEDVPLGAFERGGRERRERRAQGASIPVAKREIVDEVSSGLSAGGDRGLMLAFEPQRMRADALELGDDRSKVSWVDSHRTLLDLVLDARPRTNSWLRSMARSRRREARGPDAPRLRAP